MADPLKKVQSGDKLRIPASAYNAFIDSALDLRSRQQSQGQSAQPTRRNHSIVLVKNASGADQDRYAVLGVDGPIYTPEENLDGFQNQMALVGVSPTDRDHAGRFVVLLEPAKEGSIVTALASGVCPVRLKVPEGAEQFRFASAREGQSVLVASYSGAAEILWKEQSSTSGSDDGVVWAIARIGQAGMPTCVPGVVVCKGPEDESSPPLPSGNRYWVQEAAIRYGEGVSFEAIEDGRIVEATNLFESPDMHHVGAGEPVMLYCGWDAEGELRHWMIAAREGGLPCGSSSGSQSSASEGSASSASSGSVSGSGSGSGDSGGGSSDGSDKSTAIVPAAFSPTGYAALFTLEAPEVRFDDVIDVQVPQHNQQLAIDPRYIAVCEPGSIRVCGVASDQPIAIGAIVVGSKVRLRFRRRARRTIHVVIRLTGIRKGFAGLRFPDRRRDQFLANERFINSAYPR